MKFYLKIFTILLSIVCITACFNSSNINETKLDKEAKDFAKKYFDVFFLKKGDFYYTSQKEEWDEKKLNYFPEIRSFPRTPDNWIVVDDFIIQYKDVKLIGGSRRIDDADKLNGIEWDGEIFLLPICVVFTRIK